MHFFTASDTARGAEHSFTTLSFPLQDEYPASAFSICAAYGRGVMLAMFLLPTPMCPNSYMFALMEFWDFFSRNL